MSEDAALAGAAAAATAASASAGDDLLSALGLSGLFEPLLEPLDLGIGFGELPAYNYLIALVAVVFGTILWRRNAAAAEAARRAREEAERSKRILERPIDPNRAFTNDQLKHYDGSVVTSPIYMSVKGVVFDVTAGEGFYGPGAGYALLAGREASRALAKMETKEMSTDLSDLGAYERQTLDDWFDRFDSKYPRVGRLTGWVDTLPPKPVVKRKPKPKPVATAAAAAAADPNAPPAGGATVAAPAAAAPAPAGDAAAAPAPAAVAADAAATSADGKTAPAAAAAAADGKAAAAADSSAAAPVDAAAAPAAPAEAAVSPNSSRKRPPKPIIN